MKARIQNVSLVTVLAFLLVVATASAHAYPITTSPAIGAVVKAPPTQVSITYDEAVTVPSLSVYDAAGRRVSSATVTHPTPARIAVAIPTRLSDGTYTVAWRVTSADTHIVHGVYTFSVGRRGQAGHIGAELLARGNIPEGILLGFGIIRFVNLALLMLCGGGAIALLWILGDADDATRLRLLRSLTIAAVLLALFALIGLPFEAAESSGTGLRGGFGQLALDSLRHERFGEVWLARAWLAAFFALLSLSLQIWGRQWRLARQSLLALVGICLLLTSTDSGHSSVSGPVAFIADGVHITGAAIWIGGLTSVVAALVFSGSQHRWTLAMTSVPRFSLTATLTVPVLGAAGIVLAYIEVHAWRGLWETTYGILVLTKIGLVLPLLALAAYNNRVSVRALRTGAADHLKRTRFVRAVGVELCLLVAILGVTAALVDEAPAKTVLAASGAATPTGRATTLSVTRSTGPFKATLTLRPGVAGDNTVEMKVTSARHLKIGEVDLAAVPPGSGRRPINLDVIQLSPSGFRVVRAPLRDPGRWDLEMTIRQGLTEWLTRFPVTITRAP